jgi:hypothetical protein
MEVVKTIPLKWKGSISFNSKVNASEIEIIEALIAISFATSQL